MQAPEAMGGGENVVQHGQGAALGEVTVKAAKKASATANPKGSRTRTELGSPYTTLPLSSTSTAYTTILTGNSMQNPVGPTTERVARVIGAEQPSVAASTPAATISTAGSSGPTTSPNTTATAPEQATTQPTAPAKKPRGRPKKAVTASTPGAGPSTATGGQDAGTSTKPSVSAKAKAKKTSTKKPPAPTQTWKVIPPTIPPPTTEASTPTTHDERGTQVLRPRIWASGKTELLAALPVLAPPRCVNGVSWTHTQTPIVLLEDDGGSAKGKAAASSTTSLTRSIEMVRISSDNTNIGTEFDLVLARTLVPASASTKVANIAPAYQPLTREQLFAQYNYVPSTLPLPSESDAALYSNLAPSISARKSVRFARECVAGVGEEATASTGPNGVGVDAGELYTMDELPEMEDAAANASAGPPSAAGQGQQSHEVPGPSPTTTSAATSATAPTSQLAPPAPAEPTRSLSPAAPQPPSPPPTKTGSETLLSDALNSQEEGIRRIAEKMAAKANGKEKVNPKRKGLNNEDHDSDDAAAKIGAALDSFKDSVVALDQRVDIMLARRSGHADRVRGGAGDDVDDAGGAMEGVERAASPMVEDTDDEELQVESITVKEQALPPTSRPTSAAVENPGETDPASSDPAPPATTLPASSSLYKSKKVYPCGCGDNWSYAACAEHGKSGKAIFDSDGEETTEDAPDPSPVEENTSGRRVSKRKAAKETSVKIQVQARGPPKRQKTVNGDGDGKKKRGKKGGAEGDLEMKVKEEVVERPIEEILGVRVISAGGARVVGGASSQSASAPLGGVAAPVAKPAATQVVRMVCGSEKDVTSSAGSVMGSTATAPPAPAPTTSSSTASSTAMQKQKKASKAPSAKTDEAPNPRGKKRAREAAPVEEPAVQPQLEDGEATSISAVSKKRPRKNPPPKEVFAPKETSASTSRLVSLVPPIPGQESSPVPTAPPAPPVSTSSDLAVPPIAVLSVDTPPSSAAGIAPVPIHRALPTTATPATPTATASTATPNQQLQSALRSPALPSLPAEVKALIDTYVSGMPVVIVASRARMQEVLKGVEVPKECGYGWLGFFRIQSIEEKTGLSAQWRFRIEWVAGGDADILDAPKGEEEETAQRFESPWWAPSALSPRALGKQKQPSLPSDSSLIVIDTSTPPLYLNPRLAHPSSRLTQAQLKSSLGASEIVPASLRVTFNSFVPNEAFPSGWLCTACGRVCFQVAMRHRRCGSSRCVKAKDENVLSYAQELDDMRGAYSTSPCCLPFNECEGDVVATSTSWNTGMRTMGYYFPEPNTLPSPSKATAAPSAPAQVNGQNADAAGSSNAASSSSSALGKDGVDEEEPKKSDVWVKHVFTCNLPHLQKTATELLTDVQKDVEVLRDVRDPSSPFFEYVRDLLNPSAAGGAEEPAPGVPKCLVKAGAFIATRASGYAEVPKERMIVSRVEVLAWLVAGGRKGQDILRAKESPMAVMCLGSDVVMCLTPQSRRALEGGAAKALKAPGKKAAKKTTTKKKAAGTQDTLQEDVAMNEDDLDEDGLQDGGAASVSSGPAAEKLAEGSVQVTLVHGDVLVLSGDDFAYSLKRSGTGFLIFGVKAGLEA